MDLKMKLQQANLVLFVILLWGNGILIAAQQRIDRHRMSAEVKSEFLHAWDGYKKYAWGNDDLKPLSKSFHNWYAEPLLMTPVDALDTMYLMDLKQEADTTRKYITDT